MAPERFFKTKELRRPSQMDGNHRDSCAHAASPIRPLLEFAKLKNTYSRAVKLWSVLQLKQSQSLSAHSFTETPHRRCESVGPRHATPIKDRSPKALCLRQPNHQKWRLISIPVNLPPIRRLPRTDRALPLRRSPYPLPGRRWLRSRDSGSS